MSDRFRDGTDVSRGNHPTGGWIEPPSGDIAARAAHNIQGGAAFYKFSGFSAFVDVTFNEDQHQRNGWEFPHVTPNPRHLRKSVANMYLPSPNAGSIHCEFQSPLLFGQLVECPMVEDSRIRTRSAEVPNF